MKGFIVILVAYGIINLILYGGQEAYHAGDKHAYETLAREMDEKKADIEAKRGQIQALEADIAEHRSHIDRIKADVHGIEQQYSSAGAPHDVYSRYENMLAEGNALIRDTNLMVDQHNQLVDSFNAEINAYNAQVPTFNDLGHRAFDRWVLIPIPLGHHAPAGELGPARGLVPVPAR